MAPATPYQKEWYRLNRDRVIARLREHTRELRLKHPERLIHSNAKDRARKRNIPFNIVVADITIPERCPVFDEPMVRMGRYAPSLDRIDPTLGYTKENIQVISRKANLMKNDATREELVRFARWVNQSTT